MITIGIVNFNGDKPRAVDTAKAPNPTCDNPSPIIEYFFRTKLTPRRDAHNETNTPTITALIIKV